MGSHAHPILGGSHRQQAQGLQNKLGRFSRPKSCDGMIPPAKGSPDERCPPCQFEAGRLIGEDPHPADSTSARHPPGPHVWLSGGIAPNYLAANRRLEATHRR